MVQKNQLASKKVIAQPMDSPPTTHDFPHQTESEIVKPTTKTEHPKKADARKDRKRKAQILIVKN